MTDGTNGKIMFFVIQDQRNCTDGCHKLFEFLHFFRRNRACRSQNIVCIFQHVSGGILIAYVLRSAHRMTADKMSFQIRVFLDLLMDAGFDTSHIRQQHIIMQNAG